MISSKDIHFDINDFEPVDSQGYSMEGYVTYKNKKYPIYLTAISTSSYEEQIKEQLMEMLQESA